MCMYIYIYTYVFSFCLRAYIVENILFYCFCQETAVVALQSSLIYTGMQRRLEGVGGS